MSTKSHPAESPSIIDVLFRHMLWRAVFIAGLVGGTVFLLTYFLLSTLFLDVDAPFILRYFAGLVLGADQLLEGGATSTIVGLIVHYVLSLVFAVVVATVIHRWGLTVGILGGAIMGLALYAINIYGLTYFYEWFFALNSRVLLFTHLLYGATVGGVYELLDNYDLPLKKEQH